MKKNIYTEGIDKIKASDELIQKGIESIREYETRGEVINLKSAKAKKIWIKPLSVIAASLAIIIGLNSISFFSMDESVKNPFVLTANAEELNNEAYIRIGKLDYNNYSTYWRHISSETGYRLGFFDVNFDLNLECVGENIESVTYSSGNSRIYFKEEEVWHGFSANFNAESIEAHKSDTAYFEWYNEEDTYTFDYDKQPYRVNEGVDSEENTPLSLAFSTETAEDEDISIMGPDGYEMLQAFIKAFNRYAENLSVDITATYTDGSTLTKTLKFKCEESGDGKLLYLSAIVV